MKNLLDNIKAWYRKVAAKEPSYDRKILRPENDWMIVLVAQFVVIVLCAGVAYYFYVQVDSGKMFTKAEEVTQSEARVNMNLLKKTVEDWNLRATTLTKAKQGGIAPADPAR